MNIKPRVYDHYVPLARVTAPSFRYEKGRRDEPIFVITAIDDRFYPQQWDTSADLFNDVGGENRQGDLPDGFDRRKDWSFVAYLKDRPGKEPFLVGLDAAPSRVYRKSVLPTKSMDFKTLVISWRPSGLVEVIQRPPLVSYEMQIRIIKTINDQYLLGKKKLEPGTRLVAGKTTLGSVVRISDSEIEIRPQSRASSGKPVYATEEE